MSLFALYDGLRCQVRGPAFESRCSRFFFLQFFKFNRRIYKDKGPGFESQMNEIFSKLKQVVLVAYMAISVNCPFDGLRCQVKGPAFESHCSRFFFLQFFKFNRRIYKDKGPGFESQMNEIFSK